MEIYGRLAYSGNSIAVSFLNKLWLSSSQGFRLLDDSQTHTDIIQSLSFSHDGKYLVSSGDDKAVKLWDTLSGKCCWSRTGPKKFLAACIDKQLDYVLAGDKFGDVARFPVHPDNSKDETEDEEKTLDYILGHISVINDMFLSQSGDRLLTAVRDEKIRVSRYPDAYNIQAFCMAHTSFVTTIAEVPSAQTEIPLFVSSGADGSVKLWNMEDGVLQDSLFIDQASKLTALQLACGEGASLPVVACIMVGIPEVRIYSLEKRNNPESGRIYRLTPHAHTPILPLVEGTTPLSVVFSPNNDLVLLSMSASTSASFVSIFSATVEGFKMAESTEQMTAINEALQAEKASNASSLAAGVLLGKKEYEESSRPSKKPRMELQKAGVKRVRGKGRKKQKDRLLEEQEKLNHGEQE